MGAHLVKCLHVHRLGSEVGIQSRRSSRSQLERMAAQFQWPDQKHWPPVVHSASEPWQACFPQLNIGDEPNRGLDLGC